MKMQAGQPRAWTVNVDIEAYHADLTHDSSSSLKLFRKSPAEYHERRVLGRITGTETQPQRLGKLDHVTVIEPHNFDKLVRIIPQEVLGKNGAKSTNAWYAWEAENPGFIHALQSEVEQSRLLADKVRANPAIRKYLDRATIFEESIFWDNGIDLLKCRIDIGIELEAVIIDVKRTKNMDDFWRAIQEHEYQAQAATYCDGYEAHYRVEPSFRHILLSPNGCDSCITKPMPLELIDVGRQMNAKALRELHECRAGIRPWLKEGYDVERDLDIPPWMIPSEPVNTGARNEY